MSSVGWIHSAGVALLSTEQLSNRVKSKVQDTVIISTPPASCPVRKPKLKLVPGTKEKLYQQCPGSNGRFLYLALQPHSC